jgi:hypothetical protein
MEAEIYKNKEMLYIVLSFFIELERKSDGNTIIIKF